MKRFILTVSLLGLATVFAGCSTTNSPSRYTQAQLNAIESRIVDASFDKTYSAASGALFDAGYTISMSDRDGGLITGERGKDNTMARLLVSPLIRDTHFRISIQVISSGSSRSDVRVKTSINGEPTVNKKAVDQIWTLMQRQVMMREPPSFEQESLTSPTSSDTASPSSQSPQRVLTTRRDDVDTGSYSNDTQNWILNKDD